MALFVATPRWAFQSILSILQALAEVGAGAEEQRAYAGFAASEYGADLCGTEFVHGREQEGLALFLGQALHGAEHLLDLSRLGEGLVGGKTGGNQAGGEQVVHLVGPGAANAVEGEVPGDADQPGADVDDGGERVPALEDPEECILDNVFSFGRVAEDGERDAVEQPGVFAHEGGEVGLSYVSWPSSFGWLSRDPFC